MPKTNENRRTVTIQQCHRMQGRGLQSVLSAHEQADDAADGVLAG